jgi:MSHA pilin protein MshC
MSDGQDRLSMTATECRLRPRAHRTSNSHIVRRGYKLRFDSSLITHHSSSSVGYTIVELVTVIVILAIVAAIAGPRFFGTRVFNERGYADEVASALRYAQKIAVGSGCNVRFAITAAGYSAMQQAAVGNRCDAASGTWSTAVLRPDGTTLSGAPPANANVISSATMIFNGKGAVVSGAANLTIGAYTLVVDAGSGLVVVQ